MQQNFCLAITGAIRSTPKEKDLPRIRPTIPLTLSLVQKLCFFYKVFKNQHPKYILNLIPVRSLPYALRQNLLKNSFSHLLLLNEVT